ncbi:MAG: BMP family ABC transporter substrate-binding protein [Acidimicrobiia bacterium]
MGGEPVGVSRGKGKCASAIGIAVALALVLSAAGSGVAVAGPNDEPCIRVAMVYEGDASLPGFEGGLKTGERYLQKKLPCAEVEAVDDIPEGPGSEQTFARLADEGFDLIFAQSFGYGDQVLAAAADYPDVKFEHLLGFQQADNLNTYDYARFEAYYLAGVLAAREVPSGKYGMIAPFAIPIIVWDINAFTLGARSVNPEATVQVVFTNDFDDPTADQQASEALIDEGAELIVQQTGSPAAAQVALDEDLPWMGHSDPKVQQFGPETFLAAPYAKWGPYFVARAEAVMDDSWSAEGYFGSTADGLVKIFISKKNVPADVRAEIKAKQKEIADGSFVVFGGPINRQDGTVVVAAGETADLEEMSTLFVEGVIGELPAE